MKVRILTVVTFLFVFTGSVFADTFFVDSTYDKYGRTEIEVHLQRTTNKIHFFVDSSWWEGLNDNQKKRHDELIYELGNIFENDIYKQMTSVFGPEPDHRVTREDRISVLFHEMQNSAGGYFNSADQYSIHQISRSNQRNLLYLNTELIGDVDIPAYLGHEFMHLLTFARKNREHGVTEEIWLNELRAEYMPTFLGYNDDYENSLLKRRAERFLSDPDISITEWTNQKADYGVVALFGEYLVDHYGVELLEKSLKSNLIGITSIDYALDALGHKKMFSDVFNEWMVAVYMNDCSLGEFYCYKNKNLASLKIRPTTNFLPYTEKGSLAVEYGTKNWAGNWHRIVGGQGTLSFAFQSENRVKEIPYILCIEERDCTVDFMEVNQNKVTITIPEFSTKYSSFTILPSLQGKYYGFNGSEPTYFFSWEAETKKELKDSEKEERLKELLAQLKIIEEQLTYLRAKLAAKNIEGLPCDMINKNLGVGMTNSREVACLQQFLKSQGVYPEGIISGNFFLLTQKAVINFQEKYRREILSPLGLEKGTGYVGPSTRSFINKIISR